MDDKTKGTSEAASRGEQQKQDEKPSVITPEKKTDEPPKPEAKPEAKPEPKTRRTTRRGRPVGSKNAKKEEVKVPELETRKAPDEVNDTYAAMQRILDTEQAQFEYKQKLAKRHAEINGGVVPRIPKPAHMLAAHAGPDPSEMNELKQMLMGIPIALSIAGFESTPPQELLEQWAAGAAKVAARHNLESETLELVNLAVMTAAVGSYYVAEVKAKKAGTWDELRKKRELARLRMSGGAIDITKKPETPEA